MKIYFLIFWYIFNSSVSLQENKDVILWDQTKKLTWNDFKGKPERRFAAASTSYDILKDIKKTDDLSAAVVVKAVFFCKDSWKNDYWAEETILNHEQKHFDVVELFARKLRKSLQDAKFVNYEDLEKRSDEIYKIIDKQMDIYQDKYDDESDGSMDGSKQKIWNKKILDEINSLEVYKNISFTVTFIKAK